MGAVLLVCLLFIATSFSLKDDQPNYRLPNIVIPSQYAINLTLEETSFSTKSFIGNVNINVTANETTSEIKLHSHNQNLTGIEVFDDEGIPSNVTDQALNETTDILTITLNEPLDPDRNYTIKIVYEGVLSDDDLHGFYQSSYVGFDGETYHIASTQFEQTHARKAFPCFDEPSLKATFTLSITAPAEYTVLHNTLPDGDPETLENGLVRTQFKTTPIMSTYLVAFVVSDFTDVPNEEDPTVTMWARPGTEDSRTLAVNYAAQLLNAMGEWTGIPYDSFNLEKMGIVAIPDFAPGAMENWGLVTFKERDLLDDGDDTAAYDKEVIATVIGHEFSHSWFGDLVTLNWWSNTWLNEGFASYFEYYLTHLVDPGLNLDKKFVIDNLQSVLIEDGFIHSEPLSSRDEDVNTPAEDSGKFGAISYHKGASIIRMFRDFVTEPVFQSGLQTYLNDNQYGNTDPHILWSYFEHVSDLPDSVDIIMENWVYKPGFPLVTVEVGDDSNILLSQTRFLYDTDQTDDTQWYIPINYITASSENGNSNLAWVTPQVTQVLSHNTSQWIIVNHKQSGFFRVNYDETLWRNILNVLNDNNTIDDIDELNRAQIIDDLLNLGRIGKLSYAFALNSTDFLQNEKSFYVWSSAFNGFSFLLTRFPSGQLHDKLTEKLSGLMGTLLDSVPLDQPNTDDHIYTLNQALAWQWACRLNQSECIQSVRDLFNEYKVNSTKPQSDFRNFIYCTALQIGEDESDWDFLWNEYLNSTSAAEQLVLLNALGCSRDETILSNYLQMIFRNNTIRRQDADTALLAIYENHPENVPVVYNYIKENYAEFINYFKTIGYFRDILTPLADTFTQAEINDFTEFLTRNDLSEEFVTAGNEAIAAAQANLRWRSQYEDSLNSLFGIGNGAPKITVTFCLLIPIILSICKLF